MDKEILITDIQRFSLHDGPGIRTTVFLKGCQLRCPWCSNPETQFDTIQYYMNDEGIIKSFGYYVSQNVLYDELIKDKPFYGAYCQNGSMEQISGGVTFSGGEPLLQINRYEEVLSRLRREQIHLCMETSLFSSLDTLEIAVRYINLFYVDVKIMNSEKCKGLLNGDINLYKSNANYLFSKEMNVVFRIPFIGGYTDDEENQYSICEFLSQYKPLKVEILKEHNLGIRKYKCLGFLPPEYKGVSEETINRLYNKLIKIGSHVEIMNI